MAKQEVVTTQVAGPEEKPPETPPEPTPPKGADEEPTEQPRQPFFAFFTPDASKFSDEQIKEIVNQQVQLEVCKTNLGDSYNVLFMFDEAHIIRLNADRIYGAVTNADREKPILLILSSPGGDIAAAYFIAKLCREYTNHNFEVAVPRQAKSAATLICCGADRIHMGSLSELGPIDPQFGGVPALALKHSVEHLAQLAKAYPSAAGMFSDYLAKSLRVEALGYYERVAKSATQYAVRLLNSRRAKMLEPAETSLIANRLVYEYTDHGFVIDAREALDIFGDSIVVCNTSEYNAANSLYLQLGLMSWICNSTYKKSLSFVGNAGGGCWLRPIDNG